MRYLINRPSGWAAPSLGAKLLLVAMRTSAVTMGVAELGDPEVLGQPGEQVSALSRRPELPDTQGQT